MQRYTFFISQLILPLYFVPIIKDLQEIIPFPPLRGLANANHLFQIAHLTETPPAVSTSAPLFVLFRFFPIPVKDCHDVFFRIEVGEKAKGRSAVGNRDRRLYPYKSKGKNRKTHIWLVIIYNRPLHEVPFSDYSPVISVQYLNYWRKIIAN